MFVAPVEILILCDNEVASQMKMLANNMLF